MVSPLIKPTSTVKKMGTTPFHPTPLGKLTNEKRKQINAYTEQIRAIIGKMRNNQRQRLYGTSDFENIIFRLRTKALHNVRGNGIDALPTLNNENGAKNVNVSPEEIIKMINTPQPVPIPPKPHQPQPYVQNQKNVKKIQKKVKQIIKGKQNKPIDPAFLKEFDPRLCSVLVRNGGYTKDHLLHFASLMKVDKHRIKEAGNSKKKLCELLKTYSVPMKNRLPNFNKNKCTMFVKYGGYQLKTLKSMAMNIGIMPFTVEQIKDRKILCDMISKKLKRSDSPQQIQPPTQKQIDKIINGIVKRTPSPNVQKKNFMKSFNPTSCNRGEYSRNEIIAFANEMGVNTKGKKTKTLCKILIELYKGKRVQNANNGMIRNSPVELNENKCKIPVYKGGYRIGELRIKAKNIGVDQETIKAAGSSVSKLCMVIKEFKKTKNELNVDNIIENLIQNAQINSKNLRRGVQRLNSKNTASLARDLKYAFS